MGFGLYFSFSLGRNSVCFLLLCNHNFGNRNSNTGISTWIFYRYFLSFPSDFLKSHISVTNYIILLKTWDVGNFSPFMVLFCSFSLSFPKCFGIFYFMLGRATSNCFSNCCVPSLVCDWCPWLFGSWCGHQAVVSKLGVSMGNLGSLRLWVFHNHWRKCKILPLPFNSVNQSVMA